MVRINGSYNLVQNLNITAANNLACEDNVTFATFVDVIVKSKSRATKESTSQHKSKNDKDDIILIAEYICNDKLVKFLHKSENEKDSNSAKDQLVPFCLDKGTNHPQLTDNSVSFFSGNDTIKSISDLSKIYEHLLLQCNSTIQSKWKFSYYDPVIKKLEITIKKVDETHLNVAITTASNSRYGLTQLINRLHNRLLNKGWNCHITDRAVTNMTNNEEGSR